MAESVHNTKKNLETYSLIWLDGSVNYSRQNIRAQEKLQRTIHHLLPFEDDQQCLQHIHSLTDHDRVVLIVSGRLGEIIVPKNRTFTTNNINLCLLYFY